MISELRIALAQQAGQVEPAPDPYGRLLARRERRRRRTGTGIAVLMVLLVLNGGWLVSRQLPHPGNAGPTGEPSTLVASLLDSPTRGSLAGNVSFLESVRRKTAQDVVREPGPNGPFIPTDPTRLRVLFAGDVLGSQRLVVVGGVSADPMFVTYVAPTGSSADDLRLVTEDSLYPVITARWQSGGEGPRAMYSVLLGPADAQLEYSANPHYLADGTVQRTWVPVPEGYLVSADEQLPPGARARYTLGGSPLYEGNLDRVTSPGTDVSIDPDPLYGRGKALPAAAQRAASLLADISGLRGKQVHYVVLWSDEVPMTGLSKGKKAIVATVAAVTADGGGPYATFAYDPDEPDASMRYHPTGSGVLANSESDLILMRLPAYQDRTDELQVIGPPTGVRAQVLRGGTEVTRTSLVRGAGRLHLAQLAPGAGVTVRVFDAAGAVLAERPFTENEQNGAVAFEHEFRGW
jgi:hypothetical protein